ncbi:MAG: phosphatase PAP2 family protein [Muricauda sp.]|nr:phosphatase PAP2 family protein [Allomuricauda sp.]MBA4746091.1 phosphatase PAP2 family protein [Allomuricauda sp.]
MLDKLLRWDRDAFVYLNGLGIERYDMFWSTVTNITTWIPLFILFLVLFFLKFSKREAFYKFLTVVGLAIFIALITHWTKISVARLRPNNVEEINTLIRILKTPTDYSFFSGHASSSFSITMLVFLFLRQRVKWAMLFFIWPILFAMSRIYVGVHFPIDILVGMVVGLLSGWLFYWLYQRFIAPYSMSVHP